MAKYSSFTLSNFRSIPQIDYLTEEQKFVVEVVGSVLPFKVSSYIIDELIDWHNFEKDPFFILTFPQKEMLSATDFDRIATLIKSGAKKTEIEQAVTEIRLNLNPIPDGQECNVPKREGQSLNGIQHKYRETVLFFPSQGQTCHAYCTFCFRWGQLATSEYRFAIKETDVMVQYLKKHPEATDVLFTGGDPAVMKTRILRNYIEAILDAELPHIKTIRIGTKALTYWPYRFTDDDDAHELMDLFKKIVDRGINLSVMAHLNHPGALKTAAVRNAISAILSTGAQIRSQSPVLRNINDNPDLWVEMWRKQVDLGIIPYYMFVARDTGAQNYFAISLENAWKIFREAYKNVSGICRTVRGPSMSCFPGKIQVVGISEVRGEKVFVLNMIQGRNSDWVNKPFFAKYNPDAVWIDDLTPAFGKDSFFYEKELMKMPG